jgi:hypothetical protein
MNVEGNVHFLEEGLQGSQPISLLVPSPSP